MASNVSTSIREATKKLLKVALVGAPNAGKSTLLNRLIMSEVSCVSNKVHTTRKNMLGVYTENNTQLEFYDSPGVVTREHMLKHRLEDSLLKDPKIASQKCDLIAVIIDASNRRECNKINRRILKLLEEHRDKTSYLVLNKVDLIKEKRLLLDIGARLSEGHLDGTCIRPDWHFENEFNKSRSQYERTRGSGKYVIELDSGRNRKESTAEDPDAMSIGFKNFGQIFSVSALNDDGVDELRESLIQAALPVETWPHGPDFVTNQKTQEVVHEIIRGKVMDNAPNEIPYVIRYKYLDCRYDEFGSLHLNIDLIAPKKYMVGKLLGEHGVTIFKIINESRDLICRNLGCDCKLHIGVRAEEKK